MEEAYHCPDQKKLQALRDMANLLRIHSIESTNTAGSGWVCYFQPLGVRLERKSWLVVYVAGNIA